jgi:site-specific DNA-methyltransferase (adenine-specific)
MSLYYQDEYVTLYHGDCLTEHREWLGADVLVTDPPYGMNFSSRLGTQKPGHNQERVHHAVAGDDSTDARDKVIQAWGTKPRVVFGTWRIPRPNPVDHRLIWHKAGQGPGPAHMAFCSQDEEIYVTGKGFVKSSPPMRSVLTTREERARQVAVTGHPTSKPVGLMELLVLRCPPGVIADPFAGSGSTLIACRNRQRHVIGVELEEKYCEIIAGRLAQDILDVFGGAS